VLEPRLVICDEPVSALDVSIQAQIVNLLMDLQAEMNLSLMFIAHDLAVVRHISHRIMVMYLGRVAEVADRNALYEQADASLHPGADPRRADSRPGDRAQQAACAAAGRLPSPVTRPSGCAFRTRCPIAVALARPKPRSCAGSATTWWPATRPDRH
jgi:ABC-type oligopeptide transport system ATPase subunit